MSSTESKDMESDPVPAARPEQAESEPVSSNSTADSDGQLGSSNLNPNAHEFTPTLTPNVPNGSMPSADSADLKDNEEAVPVVDGNSSSPPVSPPSNATKNGEKVSIASTTSGPLPFDNEAVLLRLISAQLEYFFSDYHLANDTYLLARMCEDPGRWVSVDTLSRMPRIRHLTSDTHRLKRALQLCKFVEVSPDGTKVRRPNYELPKPRPNRDLRRTIFVYGIPERINATKLRNMLEKFGTIKRIHWDNEGDEGPNLEVSHLIMKKKLGPKPIIFPDAAAHAHGLTRTPVSSSSGISSSSTGAPTSTSSSSSKPRRPFMHPDHNPSDPYNFAHFHCAFVVFQSQSQATKCVKARVRALDGMRAMHKYDYNKVAKKYASAKMKGEAEALFSPTHVLPSPSFRGPSPHHIEMVSPMISSSQDNDLDFAMTQFMPTSVLPTGPHLLLPSTATTGSPRNHHHMPTHRLSPYDRTERSMSHYGRSSSSSSSSTSRRSAHVSSSRPRHVGTGVPAAGRRHAYIDDIYFGHYDHHPGVPNSRHVQSAPYGPIAAPVHDIPWVLDAHNGPHLPPSGDFDMRDILEGRRLTHDDDFQHWTPTSDSAPPLNATRINVDRYGNETETPKPSGNADRKNILGMLMNQ